MKTTKFTFIAVLLGVMMASCETLQLGDAGLSSAPETSGATIENLFATKKDADKVLVTAYAYLPYGITSGFDSKMGGNVIELKDILNEIYKMVGSDERHKVHSDEKDYEASYLSDKEYQEESM